MRINMTDKEKLMYRIITEISKTGTPIIFKGALITRLVLAENGYTAINRQTKDIDANWIDLPPSMESLTETINSSLTVFNGELYAEAVRDYEDKKSAGLAVVETSTGNRILTMDISIKPVHGSKLYQYGDILVRGVLVNEILSDKITVLSKKLLFRRAKDIIDVYALANCVKINANDIFDIFDKTPGRKVDAFDEFYNRKNDVEHGKRQISDDGA